MMRLEPIWHRFSTRNRFLNLGDFDARAG